MRIINIVDSVAKINYGIWNAAISTAGELFADSAIASELWFPDHEDFKHDSNFIAVALNNTSIRQIDVLIKDRSLDKKNDIIITHGSWRFSTKWGAELRKKGFIWIYVPQGMLEPWAMEQKKWKKFLYFKFFEKPLVNKANMIRAVSSPELYNLKKLFNTRIELIPNGVTSRPITTSKNPGKFELTQYLFMARLHEKKGVLPLIKAWINTKLNNNSAFKLVIAGPDQGELVKILPYINLSNNIEYIGPVYDKDKLDILEKSSFYILPSYSEGFPTSVLEAMSYGLIPLISEGCNLPEAIQEGLAIPITTHEKDITEQLNTTVNFPPDVLEMRSKKIVQFIVNRYDQKVIASLQKSFYNELIKNQ